MGKIRNYVYNDDDTTCMVALKIYGPKSLIGQKNPIKVNANVTTTWQDLLIDKLKLKIPVDQGVYLFNPGYNPRTKKGSKWRTELSQQVRTYVNKYCHNMETYTVCIRHPDMTNFNKCRQSENTAEKLKRLLKKATPTRSAMPPPTPPPPTRLRRQTTPPPPAVPSTSRGIPTPSSQDSVARWMLNIANVKSHSEEENVERGDQDDVEMGSGFGGRPDDQLSVVTTASQQAEELIRLGIQREDVEDIKSYAQRQLDGMGNSTLLRMRHEVQELIRADIWLKKIVPRAPLNAYFLIQFLCARNNNLRINQ